MHKIWRNNQHDHSPGVPFVANAPEANCENFGRVSCPDHKLLTHPLRPPICRIELVEVSSVFEGQMYWCWHERQNNVGMSNDSGSGHLNWRSKLQQQVLPGEFHLLRDFPGWQFHETTFTCHGGLVGSSFGESRIDQRKPHWTYQWSTLRVFHHPACSLWGSFVQLHYPLASWEGHTTKVYTCLAPVWIRTCSRPTSAASGLYVSGLVCLPSPGICSLIRSFIAELVFRSTA